MFRHGHPVFICVLAAFAVVACLTAMPLNALLSLPNLHSVAALCRPG